MRPIDRSTIPLRREFYFNCQMMPKFNSESSALMFKQESTIPTNGVLVLTRTYPPMN